MRLAKERERLAHEEAAIKEEAQKELDKVVDEIDRLEERKEQLETILGIDASAPRTERGKVKDICFAILEKHSEGLTSGQLKEVVEREAPGVRLQSVPACLSYQASQGRLKKDRYGRYTLA